VVLITVVQNEVMNDEILNLPKLKVYLEKMSVAFLDEAFGRLRQQRKSGGH